MMIATSMAWSFMASRALDMKSGRPAVATPGSSPADRHPRVFRRSPDVPSYRADRVRPNLGAPREVGAEPVQHVGRRRLADAGPSDLVSREDDPATLGRRGLDLGADLAECLAVKVRRAELRRVAAVRPVVHLAESGPASREMPGDQGHVALRPGAPSDEGLVAAVGKARRYDPQRRAD